jgi:exportin-7
VIIHSVLTPNQNEKSTYADAASVSSEDITDHQGYIISNCFKFINITMEAMQNKKIVCNKTLELVLLFFIEQYMALTLDALDTVAINTDIIRCTSRIHTLTSKFLGTDDYAKVADLVITKSLCNLQFNDQVILNYSIFLLRTMLLKLKRYLPRDKFRKLSLMDIITKSVNEFNSSALNDKKFYKLRTQIYEIIAIMYLDDYFDTYLEALENICQTIYIKNFPNGQIDTESIIKFFRDSTGLSNYIDVSKIFKYYFKIAYPIYAQIIQNYVPGCLASFDVIQAFFDFQLSLIQNKAQRLTLDNNSTIGYEIFKDFSKFLSGSEQFFRELVISLQNKQDPLLDKKFKIIVKLWKIMNSFFKGKFINFSVFQLFGSSNFLDYFKFNLEIIFSAFEILELFPKYVELYIENFVIISESMLEIIFSYFTASYAVEIMKISIQTIRKYFDGKFVKNEMKSFQDDMILSKVGTIIYNICCFTYEEANLKYSNEMKMNIEDFFKKNTALFKEFISYIFEISFNNNKSTRIQLAVSTIMFSLIIINEKLFEEIKEIYLIKLSPSPQERDYLLKCFNGIFKGVEKKYDSSNLDKFSKNYKQAIKDISRGFESMNFETTQEIEF